MERLADEIHTGATVREAMDVLDRDPANLLDGTAALQAWMQERADEAVEKLDRSHFDIPEPLRTIECLHRPDPGRGHLLHLAQRRLLPAGPDVVVRAQRTSSSSRPGAS